MNAHRVAAAGLVLVLAGACGGGTPGSATQSASVSLSFTPDPVRAAPCPPSSCGPLLGEMEATGTLTLRESAGVAATVQRVDMEMRFAGGTLARGDYDTAGVAHFAGSARVAAGATLAVPLGMHFTPAPGLLPATWVLAVTLQDDRGHRLAPSVSVSVQ